MFIAMSAASVVLIIHGYRFINIIKKYDDLQLIGAELSQHYTGS